MKLKLLLLLFIAMTSQAQSTFTISVQEIAEKLRKSPTEKSFSSAQSDAKSANLMIELPQPNGQLKAYWVIESPLMSLELKAQHKEIRTFRLFGEDGTKGVLTLSPEQLHAYFLTENGNIVMAPVNRLKNEYSVHYASSDRVNCWIEDDHLNAKAKGARLSSFTNGAQLKTYRLAIVTTGEFYTTNGSNHSEAMAAVTAMVNSLRLVYEEESAISFELKGIKIYTNANTDPFNPSSNSLAGDAARHFGSLSISEPDQFGLDKYDIGHVLYDAWGGGVAYLQGPCNNMNVYYDVLSPIKAGGWSGVKLSYLETFIHEVGHQFGAGHTFNSVSGGCGGGNLMADYAYEPGSGTTYMSYFGNCEIDNLSNFGPRNYFHINSLYSIAQFNQTTTCGVITSTGNTPPVVNANPNSKNLNIPKRTAFVLEGSGYDANGDALYYNWEQYDKGDARGHAAAVASSTTAPIFRSMPPETNGNKRYFPNYTTVLAGSVANNDEALPEVARSLNFRLTARDKRTGGGSFSSELLTLTVHNVLPFEITSQNTAETWLYNGTNTATITWNGSGVAAAPFNVTHVNIWLSTDGGTSFSLLAGNTPNDGTETFLIPNIHTTQARIKIEPVGNFLFFDINNSDIVITNTCTTEISYLSSTDTISGEKGSESLNLGLFAFGEAIPAVNSIILNSASPTGALQLSNGGSCASYAGNVTKYKVIPFIVAEAKTYVFSSSNYGIVINIYEEEFNPASPCTRWMASSTQIAGGYANIAYSVSKYLTPGKYAVVVSTFDETFPVIPLTLNLSISGGTVYKPIPNEPGMAYKYIIKNNSSQNIVAVQDQADLSDSTVFSSGNYTVYGMSVLGGSNLSSYVGQPFSSLQNAVNTNAFCGLLSTQSLEVKILGDCPSDWVLSGVATSGERKSKTYIASTEKVLGSQRVNYQAENYIVMEATALQTFEVEVGGVFTAEIRNCD